jgi:hypothetical protein
MRVSVLRRQYNYVRARINVLRRYLTFKSARTENQRQTFKSDEISNVSLRSFRPTYGLLLHGSITRTRCMQSALAYRPSHYSTLLDVTNDVFDLLGVDVFDNNLRYERVLNSMRFDYTKQNNSQRKKLSLDINSVSTVNM